MDPFSWERPVGTALVVPILWERLVETLLIKAEHPLSSQHFKLSRVLFFFVLSHSPKPSLILYYASRDFSFYSTIYPCLFTDHNNNNLELQLYLLHTWDCILHYNRFYATTIAFFPMVPVGPQALPTLLKAISYRKGVYLSLIAHSPKLPRWTQGELMDAANPLICQQSPPQRHPWGSNPWPRLWYHL